MTDLSLANTCLTDWAASNLAHTLGSIIVALIETYPYFFNFDYYLGDVLFCRMQWIYREVEPGVEQRDARHLGQAFRGAQCSGELHHHRIINIIVIFLFIR